MKDKLVLECGNDYLWRITWHIADDDYGVGATLGEGTTSEWSGAAPKDREDWEHWAAQRAAFATAGVERDRNGFFWESAGEAKAAFRIVKEALKQERPMPEWATKALAEGWKPPKGWKA
jgi:hypothetical protein